MKIKHITQAMLVFLFMCFITCNKDKYYEGEKDSNKVKGYSNENYYPSGKMDSVEVISHITAQKLQEVYDLAILVSANKLNKGIDTLLVSQLQGYFPKGDTVSISNILKNLDSLRAKYVKIELEKKNEVDSTILNDSIGRVQFKVHFFNKNKKYCLSEEKQASYILVNNPKKFKSEFRFYFSSIGNFKK